MTVGRASEISSILLIVLLESHAVCHINDIIVKLALDPICITCL